MSFSTPARDRKSGYLPSLDGWRAVSILGVLAAHSHPSNHHALRVLQEFGGSGVYVFFAISGILICTRLLEEERLSGAINLRGFYIRRLLRIQPAALMYLAVVAAVMLLGWFPQAWRFWWGAVFLYRNFQIDITSFWASTKGFLTGHFWTLAVEEHFYLLLSLFLFFVTRRRVVWLGLLGLAACLWPFAAMHFFAKANTASAMRHTDMQLQYLIPATWLALLLQQPRFRAWAQQWLKPLPLIVGSTMLSLSLSHLGGTVGAAFSTKHPGLAGIFLPYWQASLIRFFPLWVLATVLHPSSFPTRLLEWKVMKWIGRISYSLYLWHVLFFRGLWPAELAQPHSLLLPLTHAPWNLIAAVVAASASFYLLERPLMRLGHRLAPPATPGRLDMSAEPLKQLGR